MIGTMLKIAPAVMEPLVLEQKFTHALSVEAVREALDGGALEIVPQFTTIIWGDVVMDCVAICDEDGKGKGLPNNPVATGCWEEALRRQGMTLLTDSGKPKDFLCGPILVIFGDREFMDAL